MKYSENVIDRILLKICSASGRKVKTQRVALWIASLKWKRFYISVELSATAHPAAHTRYGNDKYKCIKGSNSG
jgi:hypothetical protein